MKTTEIEIDRVVTLTAQYTEKQASIVRLKSAYQRISHEIGQARVAHLIETPPPSPKETEARLRRLETELKTAENELSPLGTECAALAGAIEQIESEVLPKRHGVRLAHQAEMQRKYKAVCLRIVEAANALAVASVEARDIYRECSSAYPADAFMGSQAPVLCHAGLAPVINYHWVSDGSNPTQRDNIIGTVWDYDRSLIDPDDLVAIGKLHQENWRKQWLAEQQAEYNKRNPPRVDSAPPAAPRRSLTTRSGGAIVDETEVSIRVKV